MSAWATVLVASAVAFALKGSGYLIPAGWLEHPRIARISELLPVCLLAALIVVQAFAVQDRLVVDARAAGLAVAFAALLLRAPFVLVVVLAAGTAAGLRAAGLG